MALEAGAEGGGRAGAFYTMYLCSHLQVASPPLAAGKRGGAPSECEGLLLYFK